MHALARPCRASARLAARRDVVERARDDARGRGLADAAHAGEHKGVRDAARRQRRSGAFDHGLLADQPGEVFGRYLRASAAWLSVAGAAVSASAFFLGERLGAVFWSSASAIERQDFHAECWQGRGTRPRPHYNARRQGGRLDEQPAKHSLGLLPSGPDPIGEARACRQPPAALYRGCRPPWQPTQNALWLGRLRGDRLDQHLLEALVGGHAVKASPNFGTSAAQGDFFEKATNISGERSDRDPAPRPCPVESHPRRFRDARIVAGHHVIDLAVEQASLRHRRCRRSRRPSACP